MKPNIHISICILATVCLLAFGSCRKKKEEALKNSLAGKWKKEKVAWDNNNNERADDKEMEIVPEYLAEYMTFNSDGTGIVVNMFPKTSTTYNFTWSVIDKENIKVIISASGYTSENEYFIQDISNTELVVKTNSPSTKSSLNWRYFRKQ